MSAISKIQWTQATWNPTLGCSKISPGCKNCYAIKDVHRMSFNPNPKVKAANQGLTVVNGNGPNWTGKLRLIPERLDIPTKTRKPTTYFVNSLSDLFHEDLDDDSILEVFRVMQDCPQHRFQVLTKRSKNMLRFMREWEGESIWDGPVENVWLGVSVESRDYLSRIDHLRQTPAALRFLSLEPLLEDLGDISKYLDVAAEVGDGSGSTGPIDWVIVGGESGPGARPVHIDWIRSIRDQCVVAGVPFFFKQWGEAAPWVPGETKKNSFILLKDGRLGGLEDLDRDARPNFLRRPQIMARLGKKKAGRLLDCRTWDEMPQRKGASA